MILSYLIRHIATSFNGDAFAAAEFEKVVYIWSFEDLKRLKTLDTKLDFGGKRLAISPKESLCAVGAYSRYGITMYDLNSGQVLWNNKELKKVQRLEFSLVDDTLYACFDDKPMHVINSRTGDITEKIKGIKNIWFSPYDNIYLTEGNNLSLHNVESNKTLIINRETFAILDVKFAEDILFICESGGPLRAISINDGRIIWQIKIEDSHFLRIGYCEETNALYAVLWPYINGGNKILYKIEKLTGNVLGKTELEQDTVETEFIKKSSFLINSNGNVYGLTGETPKIVNKINWT